MRKIGHYITNGFNKIGFLTINKPDKIINKKNIQQFLQQYKNNAYITKHIIFKQNYMIY